MSGTAEDRRRTRAISSQDLRRLARGHAHKAVDTLVRWMESEDPKAAIPAAKELLNRGYGQAPQSIEISEGKGGLSELSDDQLALMYEQMMRFAHLKAADPELYAQVLQAMEGPSMTDAQKVIEGKVEETPENPDVVDLATHRALKVACKKCRKEWVAARGSYSTVAEARAKGVDIQCPQCKGTAVRKVK